MYYALVFYPQLDSELREPIDQIRRKYDPTADRGEPHITIVFPVPDVVGEAELVSHIEDVLGDWRPFEIRLGGFHKSRDHWLFLTVAKGERQVKDLYQSLYTGILGDYRRDDIEFVPHLGLGLFINKGSTYDWDHPEEADLDRETYDEALQQAKALPLGSSCVVEKLHLVKIPNEVLDWATGKRACIPEDWQFAEVREFSLGNRGA